MGVKVTIPNNSSDSVTFGSANTPVAAEVKGLDNGSSNGSLAFNTTASGTSTEQMRITSNGGVSFGSSGTAYGSSGQILQSNGNAPPTWVAASSFPSGTLMLFQQTSAPTGWTKQTTHDNKALRVVSGTAGSGGSVAFTTAFASGLSADATTLSTTQIPSHNHTYNTHGSTSGQVYSAGNMSRGVSPLGAVATYNTGTNSTGGGGSHSHTLPSFAVQYVDLIIASKN